MAMAQSTVRAFEALHEHFGSERFCLEDIFGMSDSTFYRYYEQVGIVREEVEELSEYSVSEVLDLLNSCAGDDCYSASWNFQLRDGHIYDVLHAVYYHFV